MADKPNRAPWGAGRVAFVAHLHTIRAEIAQGWPLAAIYARHKDALGIGYSGFRKLVGRYAADANPFQQSRKATSAPAPRHPATPAGDSAPTPPQDRTPDARHPPRGTFDYDGNPKQDDKSRLVGERRPAGK